MSRPFSRIIDDQESGSEGQVAGAGTGAGAGGAGGAGDGSGSGVRGWWRNSRGAERRRESINSNESIPKSPSQGNEMVSVSSNFAGLSPIITPELYHPPTSNSPVSPRTRSNSMLSASQQQQPLQNSTQHLQYPMQSSGGPQSTTVGDGIVETGNPIMVEVVQTQFRAQRPIDAEAQQGARTGTGKWWWQRGSLKGLQSKLLTCLVAGVFLAITLAVYLGLALNNDLKIRHEWHVLLILIILVATMFFCHALVRLCIMATNSSRFQRASRNFSRIPSVSGPDGYANPREPIQIQTHFEHDVDGVEPDLTKMPPPVYGLWRCSVRVNPDQFYWVRRTSAQQPTIPEGREPTSPTSGRPTGTPRPPSYTSDDGVSYALAANNSSPPTRPDLSLPLHPSEMRRL